MNGEQLGEPCHLHHRVALLRQSGKRELLSNTSPVYEDLHQGTHSGGIQEGHAAKVDDELLRGLDPHGLDEIVYGLQGQFAFEPDYSLFTIALGLLV